MNYQNKKVAGIWIDSNHAYLIASANHSNEGEYEIVKKIESGIMIAHGSSEHVQHQKESQHKRSFFKELCKEMDQFNFVLLFGPGKMQEQLKNFANENDLCNKVVMELKGTDHQTRAQLIATVKKHFL